MYLILKTILDSIFPLSSEDERVLSYAPENALKLLPPAPDTPISGTFSIFAYKNPLVTKLVWNIKYRRSVQAVKIGGYVLYQRLLKFDNPLIVIPIPITNRRRKERGYNQCELLIDEIERLDTERRLILRKNLLERIHHLDRQTLKNRNERLESVKDIFAVNETVADELKTQFIRDSILKKSTNIDIHNPEPTIVIIDDVITTGSTMKEAMETLREVGFITVYGLSLAH